MRLSMAEVMKWPVLYPVYLDKRLTRAQGRRVPLEAGEFARFFLSFSAFTYSREGGRFPFLSFRCLGGKIGRYSLADVRTFVRSCCFLF
jgi:hypothetical protein